MKVGRIGRDVIDFGRWKWGREEKREKDRKKRKETRK